MKVIVEDGSYSGTPLQQVQFGKVVRLTTAPSKDPCYYLVASEMNGTDMRVLVSLRSGTIRRCSKDRVIVVSATVYIHGDTGE